MKFLVSQTPILERNTCISPEQMSLQASWSIQNSLDVTNRLALILRGLTYPDELRDINILGCAMPRVLTPRLLPLKLLSCRWLYVITQRGSSVIPYHQGPCGCSAAIPNSAKPPFLTPQRHLLGLLADYFTTRGMELETKF